MRLSFSAACLRTICGITTSISISIACLLLATELPGSAASGEEITASQEVVHHKLFQVNKVKVNAPPEAVWAILTNYEDSPRVYSKVTHCHVVLDEGGQKLVAFKVKAFKDLITFDYTLNITEHSPDSIEWTRNCGAFKANEGYWHLQSTDEGKACLVTFAKFIDGGAIPQFFIVKELRADMPLIIANVKSCAELYYQDTLRGNIVKRTPDGRAHSANVHSGLNFEVQ